MTSSSHKKGGKKPESTRQIPFLVESLRSQPKSRRDRDHEDESLVAFDFCGISMLVRKPTKEQIRIRIAEGQNALAKLSKILAKPGVKLALSNRRPIYVADKRDPSLVVQTIGSKSRRGKFDVNGRFVEVK